jgi:dTDP-4-amino-4,6-dideoxy-D-galactose acyltransferase
MSKSIEFLAWDSEFFRRKVGRLNLKSDTTVDELIQVAHQQRYELLYIYSPVPIAKSSAGEYDLLDVGGHITFTKSLSDHSLKEVKLGMGISEFQLNTLTPELLETAFLSGHLSRFKIDSSLPAGSFESLYKTWLTNTLERRPKSSVYIYHCDNRIVGLITSETHGPKCTIGLLAVLQSYQGKGIATMLIRYMQEICIENKVTSVEVKTQLSNISARALYLKNSFAERERSFLYHAHNVKQARL